MESRDKLQTTEINQGLGVPGMFSAFTHNMSLTLQIIAVVIGVPSVICGLINILLIKNLHSNHTRYRHTLLTLTFALDFSKCLFYTIYSFLQLSSYNIYDMPVAYNVLGFLTHMSITSCDSMALFLTLHFAILIFKPKLGIYSKNKHILREDCTSSDTTCIHSQFSTRYSPHLWFLSTLTLLQTSVHKM